MSFSLIYICCSFWGGILSVVFPTVAICFWPAGNLECPCLFSDLILFPFLLLFFYIVDLCRAYGHTSCRFWIAEDELCRSMLQVLRPMRRPLVMILNVLKNPWASCLPIGVRWGCWKLRLAKRPKSLQPTCVIDVIAFRNLWDWPSSWWSVAELKSLCQS